MKTVEMEDLLDIEKNLQELRNKLITNQAKREDLILNYSNVIQTEREEYYQNEVKIFTQNLQTSHSQNDPINIQIIKNIV